MGTPRLDSDDLMPSTHALSVLSALRMLNQKEMTGLNDQCSILNSKSQV